MNAEQAATIPATEPVRPHDNCSSCHFGKRERGAFGIELVRCAIHGNTFQASWHCSDWEARNAR